MVLQQHDDHLDALLGHGGDLHRQHLVGAVTDDRDHLVVVADGELDAHRSRDLVAHAGERVLEVVLLGGARTPQGLQVAGHRAGGVDHDVVVAHQLVQGAEDLGLGRQRLVVRREAAVDDLLPFGVQVARQLPGRPRRCVQPASSPARATSASRASATSIVAECLAASKAITLTLTNFTSGLAKTVWLGGGEVGVAGADADHEVGLTGERVGGAVAGRADAADGHPVVEVDRALAGLGVGDRDAGRLRRRPAAASEPSA